jgi:glycosyltransferase involved in cell wall biosynthesis
VTIVTTPELGEEARRHGAGRLELIPNGVPVDRFTPAASGEPRDWDVIYVGRLSPEKNIGALAEASRRLPGLRVALVGSGRLEQELKEQFAAAGCEADFLGSVPYVELPSLLRRASILVLPSRTEGRAKVVLEAMACGLPCVVSRIPSFHDLAERGLVETFTPDRPDHFASVLRGLLGDTARRAKLGAAGRRYVEENASLGGLLEHEARLLREIALAAA